MTQNRSLTGPAEAIERAKNSGNEMLDTAESTLSSVTESAHQTYDEAIETMRQVAHDTYDTVGDAFRSTEEYVRREPMRAVAIAAALGIVVGYCFAVRSAPLSRSRRLLSRWS